MTSHYRWYPASEDVVIPWNASYEFPSQANKSVKITPRLPPKNGSEFKPGNVIRLEFPAQGFVHPGNTTLEFDVVLQSYSTSSPAGANYVIWFQNNINSIFTRARLLYGSTPIEDLEGVNFLIRQLTEFTTGPENVSDQKSISLGIGGCELFNGPTIGHSRRLGHAIHKLGAAYVGYPNVINEGAYYTATKRYQVQIPFPNPSKSF